MKYLLLASAGLVAGFIDSIAGGGGLITLPALSLAIAPGPQAIGTNKIVGTTGALIALLVYFRGGHVDWGRSIRFSLWVALGSLLGSRVSPFIPIDWFKWILIATCPVILWIVWKRELWLERRPNPELIALAPKIAAPIWPAALAGIVVGFYDGVWGPGGGTFMFLALLFVAKLPLLGAIAAAKLANTFSAGAALLSYSLGGYVHWLEGAVMASGMSVGAYFGATHATRNASRAVRPVLAIVVGLLAVKLLLSR